MLVTSYALDRLDFRPWARAVLGVEELEALHLRPDPLPFPSYVDRLNHYKGLLTEAFDEVEDLYLQLVKRVEQVVGRVVLRQLPPSFRCHLVGALTASSFHRDGDAGYGITPGVINAWVPLTRVHDSNSLYIERHEGSDDFAPVALQPGQILLFDGYHLRHGSLKNCTATTRVSFDFRFLPTDPRRVCEAGIMAPGLHSEAER